jgi:hypothetical protein
MRLSDLTKPPQGEPIAQGALTLWPRVAVMGHKVP